MKNLKIFYTLSFIAGMLAGSIGTALALKEDNKEEPVDDLINNRKYEDVPKMDEGILSVQSIVDDSLYASNPETSDIHTINPDEYYYDRSYEKEELLYYEEENVLVDGNDMPYDIEHTVGTENLLKFGEYEEDMVYVRNPSLEIDYCVQRTNDHYVDPDSETRYDD